MTLINISGAEKQDLQTAALEKLPEDNRYVIKSMFGNDPSTYLNLCVTTEDVTVEGLEGWPVEFQTINQKDTFCKITIGVNIILEIIVQPEVQSNCKSQKY